MLENVHSKQKSVEAVPTLKEMALQDQDVMEFLKIVAHHGLRHQAVMSLHRAIEKKSRTKLPAFKH